MIGTSTESHSPDRPAIRTSLMGEAAVLLDVMGRSTLENQARIWELARRVGPWPEVRETVLGMGNLLVIFDPGRIAAEAMQDRLAAAFAEAGTWEEAGRTVEIPVVYGGEAGPDLGLVAERAGLSTDEVIRLHSGAEYVVYALGSSPGFGYLGGLPEALFMPRRDVPILRAEGGSVMIAGLQCGVTWAGGPTGWHVIGHSTLPVFDLEARPPALLKPGDRVRFTIGDVLK